MSASFVNPLARTSPRLVAKARAIKDWTRVALNLAEDAVVSVNELTCHVPGCPPKETVVLVMQQGRSIQISIHKAVFDLVEDDLKRALGNLERGIEDDRKGSNGKAI